MEKLDFNFLKVFTHKGYSVRIIPQNEGIGFSITLLIKKQSYEYGFILSYIEIKRHFDINIMFKENIEKAIKAIDLNLKF